MIFFFFRLYGQSCISRKDRKMALLGKNPYSSYPGAEEAAFKVSRPLRRPQLHEITDAFAKAERREARESAAVLSCC